MSRVVPHRFIVEDRDAQAAKIKSLEDALYRAREDIVSLAPEEFHSLLRSYYSCKTRAETYGWAPDVADQIVERAIPIAGLRPDLFGERAYCPLCKAGAQSAYEHQQGFSFPIGLHRHLVGFGKNAKCSVLNAAHEMAREAWNSNFAEAEALEEEQARNTKKERLATEILYVVGLDAEPVLFDDVWWRRVRAQDDSKFGLKWAEQRLSELGFPAVTDGRKRSYTKLVTHPLGQVTVFADPRELGKISFRVCETGSKARKGKPRFGQANYFDIRDSFKNRLADKVAAGIEAAIQHLAKK